MGQRVDVSFIGPRTDPAAAAGRTIAHVLEALHQRSTLHTRTTAGRPRVGVMEAALRLIRTGASALELLLLSGGNMPRLYLPIDTGLDLDCGVLLAAAARLRGYRVFIHHVHGHWFDRAESRLALLDRVAGAGAVHVVPSEEQISRLRWVYRTQKHAVAAPRPVGSLQLSMPARPPLADRPLVLGVVLDIGPDPAVTDAMNTFVLVGERAGACRLIALGEPVRQTHRKHLDDARDTWGTAVEHRHADDDDALGRFLSDIDVLLLPARQTHDAWPVEVVTAMAMGVPVIARAAGCMRSLLGEQGGAVIDTNADFPRKALRLIQSWEHDPGKFDEARRHAVDHGRQVAELSQRQFDAFLDLIAPTP